MKKISLVIILVFFITGCSDSNSFKLEALNFNDKQDQKTTDVINKFNSDYQISYSVEDDTNELEQEITLLTKKTTYLLLGDFNNVDESPEDFYERQQAYYDFRYDPVVPLDDSTYTGLDENSQEYNDDLVSGISVPGMFLLMDEYDIVYNSYGDIRIIFSDDQIIASVFLPNVIMKEENPDNRMEYKQVKTDLMLYYFYKELDGEYKLYYLFAESGDDISTLGSTSQSNESSNSLAIEPLNSSELGDVYNFDKLKAVTDTEKSNIYNINVGNIVVLNSYYNNVNVNTSNGFFVDNGLVVTSWRFLEKALVESQYITISGIDGTYYELAGIVTIDIGNDIAVLKLTEKVNKSVKLGSADTLSIEDPVFTVGSISSVGATIQSGIMIANSGGKIETSIVLNENMVGSPLFNITGEVVGITNYNAINSSISESTNCLLIEEINDKFSAYNYDDIEFVTFDELKESLYYNSIGNEVISENIPSNIWKDYKSIGNIEENITIDLVKTSYSNNSISLRYKNNVNQFIDSMVVASAFYSDLEEQGYELTVDNLNKKVFTDGKYQIAIMSEFDYLIVVMVKL